MHEVFAETFHDSLIARLRSVNAAAGCVCTKRLPGEGREDAGGKETRRGGDAEEGEMKNGAAPLHSRFRRPSSISHT